jgi:hypothetical protein
MLSRQQASMISRVPAAASDPSRSRAEAARGGPSAGNGLFSPSHSFGRTSVFPARQAEGVIQRVCDNPCAGDCEAAQVPPPTELPQEEIDHMEVVEGRSRKRRRTE